MSSTPIPMLACSLLAGSLPLNAPAQTAEAALPPAGAAREITEQTARNAPLHFAATDLYLRATATALYDDNILINHTNRQSDLIWKLSPGLALGWGDAGACLPEPLTLARVRQLINYSVVDDDRKPHRYVVLDYAPSFDVYTSHDEHNNVGHWGGLSAGYDFSKLSLGLDQDVTRARFKDSGAGDLITHEVYETSLRSQYQISDRNSLQLNGQCHIQDYGSEPYQGYEEYRTQGWFVRQVGGRLSLGAGGAAGYVTPDESPSQLYEQMLGRAVYQVTGKLNLRASAGLEHRSYGEASGDTWNPAFSLSAIFSPVSKTTLSLEAYRRNEPAYLRNYNSQTYGFRAGISQHLVGGLNAGLLMGLDSVDYKNSQSEHSTSRTDYLAVARATLNYEPNSHWRFSVFYSYQRDDADIAQYAYFNHLVGSQVRWQF